MTPRSREWREPRPARPWRGRAPGSEAAGMSDGQTSGELSPAGIAVLGMAGRFPGAAGVAELWENLVAGTESIVRFLDDELLAAGVDPALLAHPAYVRAGAVLSGIDLFDAEFFGFQPREVEVTDPQQRLFLEC